MAQADRLGTKVCGHLALCYGYHMNWLNFCNGSAVMTAPTINIGISITIIVITLVWLSQLYVVLVAGGSLAVVRFSAMFATSTRHVLPMNVIAYNVAS